MICPSCGKEILDSFKLVALNGYSVLRYLVGL